MVARADAGIGALQAVKPNHFKCFIFRIRIDRARRGAAFADNLDHIALHKAIGGHEFTRHPRKTTARIFELGIGDLQFGGFGFGGHWLPRSWGTAKIGVVTQIANPTLRFCTKKGPTEADPEKVFRRGCL